ncbi:hypothetical protein ACSZOJ_19365 [Aeromonas dhakensis]
MLPLPDSLIWGALALAVLLCLARQRLPGFIMLAVACWPLSASAT